MAAGMQGVPELDKISRILSSNEMALLYLQEWGIMKRTMQCKKCRTWCHLEKPGLRCGFTPCRARYSPFDGTFFANCRLPSSQILYIAYLWLVKTPVTSIQAQLGHSFSTICDYIVNIEDMVSSTITDHECKIGGRDVIVEIDESKFGKRKYHRGHHVEGVWVVGGIERTGERRVFAVSVTSRDKDMIKTVILDHVERGSIVYTDGWAAYGPAIRELNEERNGDLKHETVNHSEGFISDSGVCTNGIEGVWHGIKCNLTSRHMNPGTVDRKILVYIWRRLNRGKLWDALMTAFRDVAYE